jgi:hypothetical protein
MFPQNESERSWSGTFVLNAGSIGENFEAEDIKALFATLLLLIL